MEKKERLDHTNMPSAIKDDTLEVLDVSVKQVEVIADHFDFPVGKPEGIGYYNAQSFGENNHLGDDWNGTGGGNTDLGDAIYAIANGKVAFAEDIGGGWGNVIRIHHVLEDGHKVESLYAHCDTILVATSDTVSIGQKIGTIGTAHGLYYAHLHFEIRENIHMPIGGGYSQNTAGYVDPTEFIRTHR
ncbi:murein hydrolase activator EnvC family protein [Spongiimicrobium salis]|uniref:murein hydrolase activator EnvC family protein n=1 Tax=Spongiimicrobium salis TaxID=1667022 RepID=UPI00374DFBC5